jgi:hypothetical protein
MSQITRYRTNSSYRVAALAAATLLVAGLLPTTPVAAAGLDTVADIEDALCPSGETGGTAVLTNDVSEKDERSGFDVTLEVDEGCEAVLDLNGKTLRVDGVVLLEGSTLTIVDTPGSGELVADAEFGTSADAVVLVNAVLRIQSGTVNATGRRGGFGIARGEDNENRRADGTLTISNGTVTATGGIGATTVTISGGTVNATGGIDATTVTISGGTVNATGQGDYAGIGSSASSASSALTISGGTVNAIGDVGYAGISSSTVTISAGTVNATGGFAAAGIGGEAGGNGGTVMISGGTVVATGGEVFDPDVRAAKAIGAGEDGSLDGTLTLGPGAVRVDSVTDGTLFPVTSITFVPVAGTSTPAGPSFFAPGGVQPSQPVASAAFVRADGSPQQLRASVPGRDQVRYEADGVSVTLQGGPGTDVARGLVANPAGEVVCEVCIAGLAAGQVVEVWLFSTPRLVAAHLTDDAECQLFTVPLSSPLDGDGPVESGAHTLQFTLATASGLEAVNVGLTVGGLVPTSVPAGEGPVTPYALVALMLVVLLGIRRAAVTRA